MRRPRRLLRKVLGPKPLLRGRAGAYAPPPRPFWERVMGRGLFPLPAALLAFPAATTLFASAGFLVGAPLTAWWGALGFLAAAALALVGGGGFGAGLRRVGWLAAAVAAIAAVDQSFVLFSWWDAQAYHLTGSRLLLEGWNPVFDATREWMLSATGADPATFNSYHVAYLPRGGWVWGAVTAALTGNLESGDTLILITAVALGALSWRVTPLLFGGGRWKRWFFASLTLLSPGVVASAFAFAQDGSLYALLMVYLLAACAYRRTGRTCWLSYVALAPILGCNLKFTGVVNLGLSAALFTLPLLWGAVRHGRARMFWKWVTANTAGFVLALVVGFSPYLTNWVNHGGPFYPEQSFSANPRHFVFRAAPVPEGASDAAAAGAFARAAADYAEAWRGQARAGRLPKMTADFDLVNADAAAMGYLGRLVNAYFSKWLAHRYYEWKLGKRPFRPVFHLDQVGGLGTGFRIVMCLTLALLLLTRRCATPWLIGAIALTALVVPEKMVGYVRYVPQLWMLPVLVAFNAMTVNAGRAAGVGRGCVAAGEALARRGGRALGALGRGLCGVGRSLGVAGRALGVVVTAFLATSSYLFAAGKLTVALAMSAYALSLVETMRAEAAAGQAPRVYVLSLHDRYREDGRCLAAWSTLSDIPAPHVFDDYYRTILPASGVHGAAWLTPEARDALRAAGEPSFYLGEHLWFWPRDPTRVRHPSMHLYAGPPRRDFSARNVWRIAKGFLPDLPAYLWRVGRFRWAQFWANAREGRQW